MVEPLEVLVLSDGTGSTAETVAKSALAQFAWAECRARRFSFVRTPDQVQEILRERVETVCVAVFSFVSPELSRTADDFCRAHDLPAIDLLSPMITVFSDAFRSEPEMPSMPTYLPEHVFELATAIEYTLNHDDGKGLETLSDADLIILGVSRTGKTPTSIFLSSRQLKVANVPIFEGTPLPEAVRKAPAPKVGFRVSLERQLELRLERSRRFGTAIPGYSDRRSVESELEYCDRVFRSLPGLATVNVTDMAVEEVADWIARNVL
jgi:regulator of PEP synthase PpsR (kinase-PPPase family)